MVGAVCLADVFFQAEDGIRDLVRSRGLGDVYKRQGILVVAIPVNGSAWTAPPTPPIGESVSVSFAMLGEPSMNIKAVPSTSMNMKGRRRMVRILAPCCAMTSMVGNHLCMRLRVVEPESSPQSPQMHVHPSGGHQVTGWSIHRKEGIRHGSRVVNASILSIIHN